MIVQEDTEHVNTSSKDCEVSEGKESLAETDFPEKMLKHPLQNRWAFWYYKNDKHRDWKENQKRVTTFDTVEDFWAYVETGLL